MAATMADHDWVICAHLIEVYPAERAPFLLLRIVVHKTDEPLARRRRLSTLTQRPLDARD